jgi:transcriptional regulator with XRE-family HTH domain
VRSGISRPQISLIENGKADPRISTVLKLLDAYGADLADLRAPAPASISIADVKERAAKAAGVLEELGLGPSDPDARLDLKESKGVDVSAERRSLATRR